MTGFEFIASWISNYLQLNITLDWLSYHSWNVKSYMANGSDYLSNYTMFQKLYDWISRVLGNQVLSYFVLDNKIV